MDSFKDDANDDSDDYMGSSGSSSDLYSFPHFSSLYLNTVAFMVELRETCFLIKMA